MLPDGPAGIPGIRWTVIVEAAGVDAGAAGVDAGAAGVDAGAAGVAGEVLTATAASGVVGAWARKIAPMIVIAASDHAREKGQRLLRGSGGCRSMIIVRFYHTKPVHRLEGARRAAAPRCRQDVGLGRALTRFRPHTIYVPDLVCELLSSARRSRNKSD